MIILKLKLKLLESVYKPREDSFLLIKALKIKSGEKILEVGTGSGIVAIHCAKAGADVTAVDINPAAITCAGLNAKANDITLKVFKSDLFSTIPERLKFDKIIFNPPYLPSDEKDEAYDVSWSGGKTGIEVTNKFLKQAKKHLNTKGEIYFMASSLASMNKINTPYNIIAKEKLGKETIFACLVKV